MQLRRRGRKAKEIIDDDVDRAADRIGSQPCKLERLGQNSLAGKRGVTVQHDGKNFCPAAAANAVLLGARASDRDGINSFQMARVRREMDVQFLALPRAVLSRGANGILDVTAADNTARVHILE